MTDIYSKGPIAGEGAPLHGGHPTEVDCAGCTDCCHFPDISVSNDEATRLIQLQNQLPDVQRLVLQPDHNNAGWQLLKGPCPFRRLDVPLQLGGCRIYHDRPGTCVTFTCIFRLNRGRDS